VGARGREERTLGRSNLLDREKGEVKKSLGHIPLIKRRGSTGDQESTRRELVKKEG